MIYAVRSYQHVIYADSLERIALLVVMVETALLIMFLSHPKRGVLKAHLAANSKAASTAAMFIRPVPSCILWRLGSGSCLDLR